MTDRITADVVETGRGYVPWPCYRRNKPPGPAKGRTRWLIAPYGLAEVRVHGEFRRITGRGVDAKKTTRMTPCRHERLEAIAASLGLDARELDYFAPLLGFIGNELAELGGRARKRHGAQVSKPSLNVGVGKARVDLSVEPMHDLGRRVLGRPYAIHHNCLVALHEIANG